MNDFLDRHAGTGACGTDDGGHLVLVDKLFGDVDGFGRITFRVADDQLDGLAVDPALLVDFIHHHVGDQSGGRADEGRRTGQVEKRADLDGIFRCSATSGKNQHQSDGHAASRFIRFIFSSFSYVI